ncbi:hypothetical protein J6590_009809 [Homalodisca vitripennis]|nr:hypothetical protein J6590_009809 [Homalodisca vitripennis]
MVAVQKKGAPQIASAYQTVFKSAGLVVSGTIPIDLLTFEKKLSEETFIPFTRRRINAVVQVREIIEM